MLGRILVDRSVASGREGRSEGDGTKRCWKKT